jgi:peptidoglycan/LPS O-acetylase OafA/YrhL
VTTDGSSPYRPDIDGLRGLAVIAVVLFHAFPAVAPGGFVGVDVFFVISGFLITRIILGGLQDGTFAFSGFYARRIRRIFPALAIVLGATFAAGWFWLYADGFQRLARHIAAGVLFVSNLALWQENGYFDAAGDTKPLLHLWSLGIEEQFYLAWPLLMYAAWRLRISLGGLAASLAAASFLLNIYQTRSDLIGPFYSPLTRVWELLVGALLVFMTTAPWPAGVLRWLRVAPRLLPSADVRAAGGLALILLAVFSLDRASQFPRWLALMPVVGSALLLEAGPGSWLSRAVLSRPLLVSAGLISYPLYLWHWPLLSFGRIAMGETPSPGLRLVLVLASLVLAWLTFVWLETPVRFGRARTRAVPVLISTMGVILVGCAMTERTGGWPERRVNRSSQAGFLQYYDRMHRQGIAESYRAECDFMDWPTGGLRPSIAASCTSAGARETWLLWGDSYAQALSSGLRAIAPSGTAVAQVATSMCRPSLGDRDADIAGGRCPRANAFALERIAALRPAVVVLAQMENHLQTDWSALVDRLVALGVARVILVGPVPSWRPSLPEVVAAKYWDSPESRVSYGLEADRAESDRALAAKVGPIRHLTYASVINRLCNADGCVGVLPGSTERDLLSFDAGHLTPKGSVYVAKEVLRPLLERPR